MHHYWSYFKGIIPYFIEKMVAELNSRWINGILRFNYSQNSISYENPHIFITHIYQDEWKQQLHDSECHLGVVLSFLKRYHDTDFQHFWHFSLSSNQFRRVNSWLRTQLKPYKLENITCECSFISFDMWYDIDLTIYNH